MASKDPKMNKQGTAGKRKHPHAYSSHVTETCLVASETNQPITHIPLRSEVAAFAISVP
jgi:hypothetical protein